MEKLNAEFACLEFMCSCVVYATWEWCKCTVELRGGGVSARWCCVVVVALVTDAAEKSRRRKAASSAKAVDVLGGDSSAPKTSFNDNSPLENGARLS